MSKRRFHQILRGRSLRRPCSFPRPAYAVFQAHRISGISTEQLGFGQHVEAGKTWAPTFINAEGVWFEIRDHDEEGHIHADDFVSYGDNFLQKRRNVKRPSNEKAFIRCASLEACKEAFTLILDRALAAAGHPREEL